MTTNTEVSPQLATALFISFELIRQAEDHSSGIPDNTEIRRLTELRTGSSIHWASPMSIWKFFITPDDVRLRVHMAYTKPIQGLSYPSADSPCHGIPIVSSLEGIPYLIRYYTNEASS